VEAVWRSAPAAEGAATPDFYKQLVQTIWNYFTLRTTVPLMKKQSLFELLESKSVDPQLVAELKEILLTCEVSMFGNVDLNVNREGLLHKSKVLLEKMDRLL
jgi:hypothetical protein